MKLRRAAIGRRTFAVLLVLSLVGLAACGGSEGGMGDAAGVGVLGGTAVPTSTPPPSHWDDLVGVGTSGSWAAFPLAGPGFTAVVDGGSPGTYGHHPAIRYQAAGEEPVVVEVPGDRRARTFAWWTGRDIAVLWVRCPAWTDGVSAPIRGGRGDWLKDDCGNADVDLWRFTPTTKAWTEVKAGMFPAPAAFFGFAPKGKDLIVQLRAPSDLDPQPLDTLLRIDADGNVAILPPSPSFPAEAFIRTCILTDGSAAAAVQVEDSAEVKTTSVYVFEDGAWSHRFDGARGSTAAGCTQDHQIAVAQDRDVLVLASAKGAPDHVPVPEGALGSVRSRFGGVVAVADANAEDDAEPRAYALAGDGWISIGSFPNSTNSAVYVIEGHALLSPTVPGHTTNYVAA